MVKNKVVIVTGASQGLGKELSRQLSVLGAKIALVARTKTDLEKVRDNINKKGGTSEACVCDVTNQKQVLDTVEAITKHFGNIDVLGNGAGIWITDEIEEKRPELIEQSFKVNSMGP